MRYLSHEDTNEDEKCYLCGKGIDLWKKINLSYQKIQEQS